MADLYSNTDVRECAERIVRDDVLLCVSYLIDSLAKSCDACSAIDVDYDDLMAVCSQPDYESPADYWLENASIDELCEMADEIGADYEPAETNDDGDEIEGTGTDKPGLIASIQSEIDYAEQVCSEARLDTDYREAYEHWAVSGWLASKLAERGEMIGEICGITVWGRCTTGQSISIDGVILQIANDIIKG